MAITNFKHQLPHPQSELAIEILKDLYTFNFLNIDENLNPKEEKGYVHIWRSSY